MKAESLSEDILICDARVVLPNQVEAGYDVLIVDGKIAAIGKGLSKTGVKKIEAGGLYLAPGLIDIHIHGAMGMMCEDPTSEELAVMSLSLARMGTTAFLPTIGALPHDQTLDALAVIAESMDRVAGAEIIGIHMEGPYLNPIRAGAQRLDSLRNYGPGELEAYVSASKGLLKIMSLSPEIEGGPDLIRALARKGIVPAAVHTDADFEQTTQAISHGLKLTCHTFNAMKPIHHRQPGVIVAALLNDSLFCEFIADGVHLSLPIIEMAYRLKGQERMVLVSDAVGALGMDEGEYNFFGMACKVAEGIVTLSDTGTLAGSARPLLAGVKNLHRNTSIPLPHIFRTASFNPAHVVFGHKKTDSMPGSIETGRKASLLLLNDELDIVRVFVAGREIAMDTITDQSSVIKS